MLPVLVFSAALVYSGAASGTPWQAGDLVTYQQGAWSGNPTAESILVNNYDSVYSSNFGIVEVGIPGAAGFSLRFAAPSYLIDYLPSSGTLGPLNADLINPTSTASGAFGGEVLALKLNVDFSDAGLLVGTSGLRFGDLILKNLGFRGKSLLNGLTVRQFLDVANTALGGGETSSSIADLASIAGELNASFGGGGVSQFAQDHVMSPAAVPAPVFPYSDSSPRGNELRARFAAR